MSETHDQKTVYAELTGESGLRKVAELIKRVRIAMLTTSAKDGSMSSRPMAVQDEPFDGTLWFLTRSSSDKVEELSDDRRVTLTFAEPKDSIYVALKGTASVSQDRARIKELWNPMYKAWFPGGEADPQIAVLKVHVDEGDFWEASGSRLIRLARYAAAAVSGGSVPMGRAGHIEVS
jgi:general stress protein 26